MIIVSAGIEVTLLSFYLALMKVTFYVFLEYTEDNRLCKDEKYCSFNNFGKYEVSQQSSTNECVNSDELGVGSVVEVEVEGERLHGVIKWIGMISYGSPIEQTVAGIEMVSFPAAMLLIFQPMRSNRFLSQFRHLVWLRKIASMLACVTVWSNLPPNFSFLVIHTL